MVSGHPVGLLFWDFNAVFLTALKDPTAFFPQCPGDCFPWCRVGLKVLRS